MKHSTSTPTKLSIKKEVLSIISGESTQKTDDLFNQDPNLFVKGYYMAAFQSRSNIMAKKILNILPDQLREDIIKHPFKHLEYITCKSGDLFLKNMLLVEPIYKAILTIQTQILYHLVMIMFKRKLYESLTLLFKDPDFSEKQLNNIKNDYFHMIKNIHEIASSKSNMDTKKKTYNELHSFLNRHNNQEHHKRYSSIRQATHNNGLFAGLVSQELEHVHPDDLWKVLEGKKGSRLIL